MKTLNEILNDKYKYLSVYWNNKTTKEAIEAIKEWLTQKRQEGAIGLIAKEAQRNYNMVIEELLDSLESPTGEELQEE